MSAHDPQEHSVTVITKIVLNINSNFENCYSVAKYDYESQKKYYDEYATTNKWEIYSRNAWNAKANIDQMIALKKRILENRPVLIICERKPECDEYLTFCHIVQNGKSRINYSDYLFPTQTSRSKYYSYEFEGGSLVDAYTIPDDLLKQVFTRVVCRNLRNRSQLQKLKTFKFDLKFKFCFESLHQEIITYINLQRLQSLFKLTWEDITLTCDFTDPHYDDILNYYKENCAPEVFSQLVRKRKHSRIEGESCVFDTDGTYLDLEILKKQKQDCGEFTCDSISSFIFYK